MLSVANPQNMAKLISSFSATGHGWLEACVSLLFLEKCGRIDVIATITADPADIDFRVDF